MEGSTPAGTPAAKTKYRVYLTMGEAKKIGLQAAEGMVSDDLLLLGRTEGHERGQAVGALLDNAPQGEAAKGGVGERLAKAVAHVDGGKRLMFVTVAETAHGVIPVETEIKRNRKIG